MNITLKGVAVIDLDVEVNVLNKRQKRLENGQKRVQIMWLEIMAVVLTVYSDISKIQSESFL